MHDNIVKDPTKTLKMQYFLDKIPLEETWVEISHSKRDDFMGLA